MMKLACLAVLALAASKNIAAAQNLPAFTGGSVMVSSQASKQLPPAGPLRSTSGVGGTAVGFTGEIGRFLAPAVSIAFEISIPSRINRVQETSRSLSLDRIRTENRHRDLLLSSLFRLHLLQNRSARVAFLAGPTVAREDTLRRNSTRPYLGSTVQSDFGPYVRGTKLSRWTMGIAYGADVSVDVNRNVSVVPDVRMYWIRRDNRLGGRNGWLGLSSFVIRPAVGIRASF
jgi:hypothetical protein